MRRDIGRLLTPTPCSKYDELEQVAVISQVLNASKDRDSTACSCVQ